MNVLELVGSGAGIAALALCVGSYACKTHKSLTLTASAGVVFWSLHFGLLGAATASLVSLLMAGRIALGVYVANQPLKARIWWTAGAFALSAVAGYLTWKGYSSLPALAAMVLSAWAGFNLKDNPLRLALFGVEAIWLANGLVTNSWQGVLSAVLALTLNTYMLLKQRRALAAA